MPFWLHFLKKCYKWGAVITFYLVYVGQFLVLISDTVRDDTSSTEKNVDPNHYCIKKMDGPDAPLQTNLLCLSRPGAAFWG